MKLKKAPPTTILLCVEIPLVLDLQDVIISEKRRFAKETKIRELIVDLVLTLFRQ